MKFALTTLACFLAGTLPVHAQNATHQKAPKPAQKAESYDPSFPKPTFSAVRYGEHCASNGVACELAYPGAPGVKHATPTDFLITTLKRR